MINNKENCAGCGSKLTFFTKPNFGGGKLNDGNRVCRTCFKVLTKFDRGFGLNSKHKYNTESILKILNKKNQDKNHSVSQIGINNFNYQNIQIQKQGIQLLESLNIIDTTKNSDTMKSRFEFVEKLYDYFVYAANNKRYISDIQIAIDQYKSMYYDKILNDYEILLIAKPNHENLSSFYGECIMKCFKRFLHEQSEQIISLKRQDAIDKRLEKILDVTKEVSYELETKGKRTPNYNNYIAEIEKIRQDTFNKRYKNIG